jgi:hypothetical protein
MMHEHQRAQPCTTMVNHDQSWKTMNDHGQACTSMVNHQRACLYIYMANKTFISITYKPFESTQPCTSIHNDARASTSTTMVNHDQSWKTMNDHGQACTSMVNHQRACLYTYMAIKTFISNI